MFTIKHLNSSIYVLYFCIDYYNYICHFKVVTISPVLIFLCFLSIFSCQHLSSVIFSIGGLWERRHSGVPRGQAWKTLLYRGQLSPTGGTHCYRGDNWVSDTITLHRDSRSFVRFLLYSLIFRHFQNVNLAYIKFKEWQMKNPAAFIKNVQFLSLFWIWTARHLSQKIFLLITLCILFFGDIRNMPRYVSWALKSHLSKMHWMWICVYAYICAFVSVYAYSTWVCTHCMIICAFFTFFVWRTLHLHTPLCCSHMPSYQNNWEAGAFRMSRTVRKPKV